MEYEFEDVLFPAVRFDSPRTPGLHLTYVIRDLLDKAGLGYTGAGFTDMNLTAEVGLLWEIALSSAFASKYGQSPGELECDGILLTPDGIGPDPKGEHPVIVEEYKCTWKSLRTHPTDVPYYMHQVKGYCYVVDTPVVLFHMVYLMGDYRGSGPMYRKCRIVFTADELWNNWKLLRSHAEREGLYGKGKE